MARDGNDASVTSIDSRSCVDFDAYNTVNMESVLKTTRAHRPSAGARRELSMGGVATVKAVTPSAKPATIVERRIERAAVCCSVLQCVVLEVNSESA